MPLRVQEFLAEDNMNRRIPFPASREKQKQHKQQEAEQDEADARADTRDILSRDEIKRNASRIQKTKEREKLEVPRPACCLSREHGRMSKWRMRNDVALRLSDSSSLCVRLRRVNGARTRRPSRRRRNPKRSRLLRPKTVPPPAGEWGRSI